MCASKAREWPRGWQILGPWAVKNLQMPHHRDWQGGQMPAVARGLELTDALRAWHWDGVSQYFTSSSIPPGAFTAYSVAVFLFSGGSRPSDKVGGGGGGRGGRSSRLWDKGGASLQKKFFRPFGPHFGLKIRGGGGGCKGAGPRAPPLDPPLLLTCDHGIFLGEK